ncbi:hypothetical protein F511_13751 [Dorcoceras hygrometricum]|uniref:Uncharacterized protein n=1 Tax=Dorcoceras hygrometricum TaxID=472368 RepID=A0A2Z7BXW4_9LAMI|nr:hypothetical protein F511_13751 [Dorcoceras hygrometricum]
MPTLTRSCDQKPLRATVIHDPDTTTGALQAGPPPGLDGSNGTNLGSNRGLTRENWSLQVDAPAMLRRRDHLLVFAFVLPNSATNSGALPAEPPPDLESPAAQCAPHDFYSMLWFARTLSHYAPFI